MIGRLLSRKGSRKGESEEEAKVYKKAHLGESLGQLYFHDELKMWVERGKENEALAEKAKLSAPPPSVGTMSAASSSTSLNTAGADAAGVQPVPGGNAWTRGRSLKDRYIVTPGAGPPPPSGTGSNSCPPSGRSALLPGSSPASGSGLVPGIPKVPGLPAGPSRPGSFFMPTPAASDSASDAAAGGNGGDSSSITGGMSQSQSGMSINAFVPGGAATGNAPAFFMPAVPASTGIGSAAESSAAEGHCESSSAAAQDSGAAAAEAPAGRESSAGGSVGELSRPGNLSFARWTPQPADGVHNSMSPPRSSGADQQRTAAGHLPYPGASSNGNHMSYAPYSNGGAFGNTAAAEGADAAALSTGATHHVPDTSAADQYGSSQWPSHAAGGAPPAAGEEGGEAGGFDSWQQQQAQDPFGQPQDPLGAPVALGQEAAAEGAWASADAEGGTNYSAAAAPAAAGGYSADAYAHNQYNGWEQQGYGYDANAYQQRLQQGAADDGEAAQQQQQQYYGIANGYSHGMHDSSGYHAAGRTAAEQQQQAVELLASEAGVPQDSAAGEAEGAAAVPKDFDQHAYYQQQHIEQQQQMGVQHHQQQQLPMLLDPVHPELPGISTILNREGSDELGPLIGSTSATAARHATSASAASAAARHQSAPGSAPHPARFGNGIPSLGGAAGGYLSVPPARSNSLHTPGAAGVNSLLPPHRASFNGSGSPPLRPESSTLTVPTPAVVGDTSMLTMVRPSSPYARSASPLTQQRSPRGLSRGNSSSPLARGDSGFPIPSPPTQVLGKPGVFVPGSIGGAAAAAAGMAPWQPNAVGSAVDAAAGEAFNQHSSAGVHGAAQGAGFGVPMVLDGYMGTTGSHPGGAGPALSQYAAAAGAGVSAPMHLAAANGNGPLLWAGSQQYAADAAANKGTDRLFGPGSIPGSASSVPWQQQHGQHAQEQRTHPYDAFVNTELVSVNWRAHHYKQPGKLNRQTPIEEFEMQRAREQEAEEQLTPTKKREAFWYRQMEHRRKLPTGSAKPSASEPAHMPSHAAAGRAAAPPSPGDSSLSQASNYTDWQQHHNQQQQQQQAAVPPGTPARAVTADAAYAVAGRSPGEEATPTSKFKPLPATAEDDRDFMAPAAAPAVDVLDGSGDASALHQQQFSMPAAAAHGSSQAPADGSSWQAEQQQHAQYYGTPSYGAEGQPDVNAAYQYPPEYYAQWQDYYAQQGYPQQGYEQQQYYDQQQQQQPSELVQQQPEQLQHLQHQALDQQQQQQHLHLQGYGSELEQLPTGDNANQQPAVASVNGVAVGGVAAAAPDPAVGLWGDGVEQQQLDAAAAAAADNAASAWDADGGAFDAVDLPPEQLPLAAADSNAAVHAEAHEMDGQYQQQQQQRSARVSMSSSTGGSQPSTAKAAAAASRYIVGSAINKIIQEHQDEAAAAAGSADAADSAAAGLGFTADIGAIPVADGWEGDAGDGWVVDEQAAAAAADGTELVPGYEAYPARASTAAADEQEQQAGDGAADADAAEGSAEAAAVAPVYPPCWQRMRQLIASTAMGDDFAAYRDLFLNYGDWLFWQLPELAAADDGTAASGNSSDLQQQQQQQAEHFELLEMYGEAQMKADVMADAFRAGGLDLDAVFEQLALCDSEAADSLLL